MSCPNRLRQLARAFVHAPNLVPALERMAELAATFSALRPGRPPLAARPSFVQTPEGGIIQRVGVASPSLDWILSFSGESFDFMRLPTDPRGTNLDDLRTFAGEAAEVFAVCVEVFGMRAHRLSLVEEGMLDLELNDAFLNGAAERLFRLPAAFADPPPFEWDWRCASVRNYDVAGVGERCNLLSTIKRLEGLLGNAGGAAPPVPFKTLRVDTEINTTPQNAEARFAREGMTAFYGTTSAAIEAVTAELLAHVGWGRA